MVLASLSIGVRIRFPRGSVCGYGSENSGGLCSADESVVFGERNESGGCRGG